MKGEKKALQLEERTLGKRQRAWCFQEANKNAYWIERKGGKERVEEGLCPPN